MSLASLVLDAGQRSLRVRSPGQADLVVRLRWHPEQIAAFRDEMEQRAVVQHARMRALLTQHLELQDVMGNGASEQGFCGVRDGFSVVLQAHPERVEWRLEVAHGAPFTGTLQVVVRRDQDGYVQLRDPILDAATTVRTTNQAGARALLTMQGVRECLMVFLHEHGDAKVDETNLTVFVSRLDPKRLTAAVADAVELAKALSVDPASPSDVEAQAGREGVRKRLSPTPIR